MRKTSTYARKLRAKGGPVHTFNGAEWINTINRVRSNSEAPPHAFLGNAEAAMRSEVVVRKALQTLLDCSLPDDPEHEHDVLAHALGVSIIRALQIKPLDNPMLPILKSGTDALRRAINRHTTSGSWGLDGEGRIALMEAIDLYAQILHMSSPAQMAKATQERIAVLLNMRKAA